jgi:hypothetical protein
MLLSFNHTGFSLISLLAKVDFPDAGNPHKMIILTFDSNKDE